MNPSVVETVSQTSLPAPTNRGGHRVLIVDDVKDSANTLAILVRLWGYDVAVAYDGVDALDVFGTFAPHTVILDIGMPGMSGFRLARLLKERGENVQMVALTGHGMEEMRRLAVESGIAHFLVKPADPSQLQTILASFPPPASPAV